MEKDRAYGQRVSETLRRSQILDAAAACFRRSGFRGASMTDISAAADMSTGHIYHYFTSKEEIVEAVIGRYTTWSGAVLDEIVGAVLGLSSREDGGKAAAIEPALTLEFFAEAMHNPIVASMFRRQEAAQRGLLKDRLEQKAGECPHAGRDADDALLLLTAALYGLVVHMALHPEFDAGDFKRVLRLSGETVLM